ncbi:MAG: flagellar biosynthetic protein FliR [Moraxellaceae bacterium]|jgi:flagellar biosynthesis protein FliR|nr:MAG: flagellar biosynthetic protein FliR [Moraxellaceae bacterium]
MLPLVLSDEQIAQWLGQFLLPLTRFSGLLMLMPVIGTRLVPARTRIVLAFFLSIMAIPLLPAPPKLDLLSLATLLIVGQELLLGMMMGFIFMLVFQVFVLAGQFMALKLGMGFSAMNDPTTGISVTSLSQFYLLLVTLCFIGMNGHILLIEALVRSYQTFPPGAIDLTREHFIKIALLSSWLFEKALMMSLPVFAFLMVINIAFGVMSRSAPQLNIFAVGFPFTVLCGLLMIGYGLNNFLADFEAIIEQGFEHLESITLTP